VYSPDWRPTSSFLAVGADFRGAYIPGIDLTLVNSPQLSDAFLTCANLQEANLGTADVAAADFTGANLRGADLSEVQGLTSRQLIGAMVGPHTRLPHGVKRPPQPGWGVQNDTNFGPTAACQRMMEEMTHLPAGSGYASRLACRASHRSAWPVLLHATERRALKRICALRPRMNRSVRLPQH
jgi:hypothetical protein